MNHSIYSADRSTHLKVVVVALIAGISVMLVGLTARTSTDTGAYAQVRVIKADKHVMVTSSEAPLIR